MNNEWHPDPVVRVLLKARRASRDTFPDLVAGLAADGDITVLRSVIDGGLLPCEESPLASRLFAAILPLRTSGANAAEAEQLVRDWMGALGAKTDPESMAYHLRFVEAVDDAKALIALGADPVHGSGADATKTTPLLDQINARRVRVVIVMMKALQERGEIPVCSYVEQEDGQRKNVRTAFHRFIERISTGDNDIEEDVMSSISKYGFSDSWQNEVGRAITDVLMAGMLPAARWRLLPFLQMLSFARFGGPQPWSVFFEAQYNCLAATMNPARRDDVALEVLTQAALDGVSMDDILIKCQYERNGYELPILAAATITNHAELAKRCLELGADPDRRLPAADDDEAPFSGKRLVDYAIDSGAVDTANVLASWKAKSAINSVVSRSKSP